MWQRWDSAKKFPDWESLLASSLASPFHFSNTCIFPSFGFTSIFSLFLSSPPLSCFYLDTGVPYKPA